VVALRSLVADAVALVERELPEVDTAACRRALERHDVPWTGAGEPRPDAAT
jgi:hypothetical protein